MNVALCIYIVSFVFKSPSGGKSTKATVPANPRSHVIVRKNYFKSCSLFAETFFDP